MLPPHAPGVVVVIASFRAGATPTQPSIGFNGTSRCDGVRSDESTKAIPFALSIVHVILLGSRSTRAAMNCGSMVYGASRLLEYPVARFVSTFWKVTTSM